MRLPPAPEFGAAHNCIKDPETFDITRNPNEHTMFVSLLNLEHEGDPAMRNAVG
jgi:hypothetical protein